MNVNKLVKVTLFLFLVLSPYRMLQGAIDHESIVKIYATNQLRSNFGSGFFISKDGLILTAYHVVKGANEIEVFTSSRKHSKDVIIETYSTEYDLAVLRVNGLSKNQTYLDFEETVPQTSESLTITGHPRGGHIQELKANTTYFDFLSSLNYKHDDGTSVFRKKIDVIPLAGIVYGGMSGGPVINEEGKVIGVLSGSFDPGGSLVWAIPIKYYINHLQDVFNIKKRPDEIEWDELTLMASGWRSFLKVTTVDEKLEDMLEDFYPLIDQLEEGFNSLGIASHQATAAYLLVGGQLDKASLNNNISAIEILNSSSFKELIKAYERLGEIMQSNSELLNKLNSSMLNIATWIESGNGRFSPDLWISIAPELHRLQVEWSKSKSPYAIPISEAERNNFIAKQTEIQNLLAKAESGSNKEKYVSYLVSAVNEIGLIAKDWSSMDSQKWMSSTLTYFNGVANIFRIALYRPVDEGMKFEHHMQSIASRNHQFCVSTSKIIDNIKAGTIDDIKGSLDKDFSNEGAKYFQSVIKVPDFFYGHIVDPKDEERSYYSSIVSVTKNVDYFDKNFDALLTSIRTCFPDYQETVQFNKPSYRGVNFIRDNIHMMVSTKLNENGLTFINLVITTLTDKRSIKISGSSIVDETYNTENTNLCSALNSTLLYVKGRKDILAVRGKIDSIYSNEEVKYYTTSHKLPGFLTNHFVYSKSDNPPYFSSLVGIKPKEYLVNEFDQFVDKVNACFPDFQQFNKENTSKKRTTLLFKDNNHVIIISGELRNEEVFLNLAISKIKK